MLLLIVLFVLTSYVSVVARPQDFSSCNQSLGIPLASSGSGTVTSHGNSRLETVIFIFLM